MGKSKVDILESEVNAAIAHQMRRRGYFVLQRERFNPSEWDILLLSPATLKIATIEIKRREWRALLSQALRAKLYSHYVVAALPEKLRKAVPVEAFSRVGIGLAFYKAAPCSLRLTIACSPVLSDTINRSYKRQVYRRFVAEYGESLYEA